MICIHAVAALDRAVIVLTSCACVSKLVLVRVVGVGSRASAILVHLDVADGQLWPSALASAAIMPQPVSISAPVRNNESLIVFHIISHVVKVALGAGHGLLVVALRKGGRECGKLAIRLMEFDLDVEGLISVDGFIIAGTVSSL